MQKRVDLYRKIHKAIRLLLANLGTSAASTDFTSTADLDALRRETSTAFRLLASHARHEETLYRPLLEAPGVDLGPRLSTSHADQDAQMEKLTRRLAVLDPSALDADARGHEFVLALSRFTAELLDHMADEEELGNPLLWRARDDEALLEVQRLVASGTPPDEMAFWRRLMLPAMSPPERLELLVATRAAAPPEVFAGVLDIARETLSRSAFAALERGLGR